MIIETTGYCGWCEVVEDCDVYESSIELFNPDNSQQHRNVPKDVLIAYNRRIGIQHIRYFAGPYQLVKDESSVAIQIDGACRRNGTQYARGGWGVFFGPNSQYNNWSLLPPNAPQTSTYAELYALLVALEMIRDELPLWLMQPTGLGFTIGGEKSTILSTSISKPSIKHPSAKMSASEDFLNCESSSSEEEEYKEEEEYEDNEEEDYEDEEEVFNVEVNKLFHPSKLPILQDTAYDELIKFNPEKQISFLGARLEAAGPIVPAGDIIVIRLATGFLKDRLLARST
ncbi:NAD dependent epimerase [Fusarium tjaetaba]|uniref:NAD dependent epimerase n=1 Tax=Fusarium tjaetaba TaxID=1567544 RepID=A0A8H5S905_9HYPO|nr:NAD dependent epimerase [Fusarium tjaetaba]KAF5648459.1 NAD dependent epimerase [Fusarium tjaetaba]